MKEYTIILTRGEIRALFDAACQMQDDFEDYYSFMGPKRAKKHTTNYESAIQKLKTKLR